MSNVLTAHMVSEITGLLLQEVGKLSLMDQQGTLTPYGVTRMNFLIETFHTATTLAGVSTVEMKPEPVMSTLPDEDPTALELRVTAGFLRNAVTFDAQWTFFEVDKIATYTKKGNKIAAVKELRYKANMGLKESKTAIEDLALNLGWTKSYPPPAVPASDW